MPRARPAWTRLILTRLIRVEEMTQYSGSFAPPISFGVFGSNVGATWSGLGGAPSAYRVNEYTAETALHDVAKNEVVWTRHDQNQRHGRWTNRDQKHRRSGGKVARREEFIAQAAVRGKVFTAET